VRASASCPARSSASRPTRGQAQGPADGWNALTIEKRAPHLAGLKDGAQVYFVHSYYPVPADSRSSRTTTDYGGAFRLVGLAGQHLRDAVPPREEPASGLPHPRQLCGARGRDGRLPPRRAENDSMLGDSRDRFEGRPLCAPRPRRHAARDGLRRGSRAGGAGLRARGRRVDPRRRPRRRPSAEAGERGRDRAGVPERRGQGRGRRRRPRPSRRSSACSRGRAPDESCSDTRRSRGTRLFFATACRPSPGPHPRRIDAARARCRSPGWTKDSTTDAAALAVEVQRAGCRGDRLHRHCPRRAPGTE
jgi:hypothetical protein